MSTRLNLKSSQQITINPVIHSFIGFLPLSRTEFVDKIKNEVESNPMLEIEKTESITDREDPSIQVTDMEKEWNGPMNPT